jgi:hypothetical protein
MAFANPVVTSMLPNVIEFLGAHPLLGTDDVSLSLWKQSCKASWEDLARTYLDQAEAKAGRDLLSTVLSSYADLARLVAATQFKTTKGWSLADRKQALERLLASHQVEQRTHQWYMDAANLLTASQFSTILKAGRTRGQLVLDKATGNVDTSQRATVARTAQLNPFLWGIRFEPVVKQLYEAITETHVDEMGRLRHRSNTHLAASPDGLVTKGPTERLGRFVEFKAPVTRPILNKIPDDYIVQMQIQMEVGDVEECDYLEVKFHSAYGVRVDSDQQPTGTRGRPVFYGTIYIIEEMSEQPTLRYAYSPLNTLQWEPECESNEHVVERVPWWTDTWFLTTVGRSRAWFESVQPALKSFWEDVALAKQGEFTLPASTRPRKDAVCKIQEEPGETVS